MPRSSGRSISRPPTRSTSSSISSATARRRSARAPISGKGARRSSPSGRRNSRDDKPMTYDKITLAKHQGLATLTLNAPDKLNAVSRKMIAEIKQAWEEIGADSSVRAVLLTGNGRGFCAGADLSDPDRKNDADSGSALDKFFNPVIRTMRELPKPIVAAVNGGAAGGGMSFAMAADIAIAAKAASFLQACSRIGLLPDRRS